MGLGGRTWRRSARLGRRAPDDQPADGVAGCARGVAVARRRERGGAARRGVRLDVRHQLLPRQMVGQVAAERMAQLQAPARRQRRSLETAGGARELWVGDVPLGAWSFGRPDERARRHARRRRRPERRPVSPRPGAVALRTRDESLRSMRMIPRRRVATRLWAGVAILLGAIAMPLAVAPPGVIDAAPPGSGQIVAYVARGVGNGHGRGLSQWGAFG